MKNKQLSDANLGEMFEAYFATEERETPESLDARLAQPWGPQRQGMHLPLMDMVFDWRSKLYPALGVVAAVALAFILYSTVYQPWTNANTDPYADSSIETITVASVEEASQVAGYTVHEPSYIPEGIVPSTIYVDHRPPRFAHKPDYVYQNWSAVNAEGVFIQLAHVPDLQGIGDSEPAEPLTIAGVPGQRLQLPANDQGRKYPMVVYYWRSSAMTYMLAATLAGPVTEEGLLKLASTLP